LFKFPAVLIVQGLACEAGRINCINRIVPSVKVSA
jgi:hypothetical protein